MASWVHFPSVNAITDGGSLDSDKAELIKLTCWGTAETDVTAEYMDEGL